MPIESVNDFVIRFANVNGSGSASANQLFARSIMRMGVPIAPRNIFPSNIQGLPTWYEVRVTEAGHLGARGGTDMMVAMNPQTRTSPPSIRAATCSTIPRGPCRPPSSATTSSCSACR
jgi:2-oxoglutarate/2-oxoacid ferredoxin oxidoreductase subunit alpha